jgi:hypothetical protein
MKRKWILADMNILHPGNEEAKMKTINSHLIFSELISTNRK